ncbi:phage tail protein I [Novosphingobium aerophilum]|uniref:phage tail protein I n=1 Tax=Novosphingobium aerophilum TaxID=2839843 RepID=UPI00163DD2CE
MTTLLPPNATAAERALEDAMLARIDWSNIPPLKNPFACQADVLPFLGWELAISHWDTTWTVAEKRAAVAGAVKFHKKKGTRAAVEEVLARFHPSLTVAEGSQITPKLAPHRFQVRAPVLEIGADFLTVETTNAIIRDVAAAKPLRSHFDFVQSLEAQATLFMAAGGFAGAMHRADYQAQYDASRDWSLILQTEIGEPVLTEDGLDYLETH